MNIMFLHASADLYGSDRSLLNLVKNLDKKKFNITVVLPETGALYFQLKKIEDINVVIKEFAILRRKNANIHGMFIYLADFIKSVNIFCKFIKSKSIDVVYTNTSVVFPGAIAAKLCGVKSIWHIREIIKNNFERRVISWMMNSFSDIMVANSKATAKSLGKKNVKVVYNAIEELEDIDNQDVSLKDENIIIGMAGRINRWKGQKLFIDMAEKVLKEESQVKFLIAGNVYDGDEFLLDELKKYISDKNLNDKVILLGQVDNMKEFYKGLDIFVLPSIQPEPFGLVVIEAMSMGLPVVATNHGGPTEIIENGIDGFLVDYRDSEDMSKVVLELIRDKNKRIDIGLKAKKKEKSSFSIDSYVKNIEAIIEEI